jgi:hypothetical protein
MVRRGSTVRVRRRKPLAPPRSASWAYSSRLNVVRTFPGPVVTSSTPVAAPTSGSRTTARRDVIDSGTGDDRARVDEIDVMRDCEHVVVAPPAPLIPYRFVRECLRTGNGPLTPPS